MTDYELAHPLYLDVQMMVSFLAYLEGGVYLSSEQTVQREKLRAGKIGHGNEVKLPSLGALLGLESSLNSESSHPIGETAETKVARHHTAASLFNALYGFLHQDNAILTLENLEQLTSVTSGTFVKLSGRYTGNPLEEMLAMFTQVMSYMSEIASSVEEARSQKSANRKSGNPQNRELAGQKGTHPYSELGDQFRDFEQSMEMRFIRKMKEELEGSPIHDVVLETASGIKAVLTVSSEYYDSAVAERLSSGDFVVLGKVTRVLRNGEVINLSRRTVVGKMEDVSDSVTNAMANIPGFTLQSNEPFVSYPAVQILPMAIFV
ncbi:hypothetical protein AB0N20_36260 [Streptomyces griseoincarnatus]